MAIVEGVNAGFVTEAPVDDPGGTAWPTNSGDAFAARFTSPAGNNIVTELGVWQHGDNHVSASYNMGIYDDNEGVPGSLIATQCSGNVTTEDTPEWLRYTGLNIPISPSTVYYLAYAIDAIQQNAHWIEMTFYPETEYIYYYQDTDDEVLTDPYDSDGSADSIHSVYAVYEAVPAVELLLFEHSLDGNVLGGNAGRMTE